jgi:hypothetical protein
MSTSEAAGLKSTVALRCPPLPPTLSPRPTSAPRLAARADRHICAATLQRAARRVLAEQVRRGRHALGADSAADDHGAARPRIPHGTVAAMVSRTARYLSWHGNHQEYSIGI